MTWSPGRGKDTEANGILVQSVKLVPNTGPRSVPRRRWGVVFLLGFGVLVNYFDRVNLSVSHESLIAAFGISNIAFGYLSSAYNWTYAICQLPVGVLLAFSGGVVRDRRDRARLPRGDPQEIIEHGGISPPAVTAVLRGGLACYAGRVIVGHGGCPFTVV